MDNFPEASHSQLQKQRPTVITVFCILTFIGAGLNIISLIGSQGFVVNDPYLFIICYSLPVTLIMVLLAGGRIAGAVLMLQLKKAGYFLYLGSEAAALMIYTYWFMGMANVFGFFGDLGIFIRIQYLFSFMGTGLFITIYSTQLKKMR